MNYPIEVIESKQCQVVPGNFKLSRLNKTQLQEFAASAINQVYAELNFKNCTKSSADNLLGCKTSQDLMRKGTALAGGWVDVGLKSYKPKHPRTQFSKVVKYESLGSPALTQVIHPATTQVNEIIIYIVEGVKKAVAVAQATGCLTYWVGGLSHYVNLADQINALPGEIRILFDNDNSISATQSAQAAVAKFRSGITIGLFKNFKGIDDLLAAGQPMSGVRWVDSQQWSAFFEGYSEANKYVFCQPQFEAEIIIPSDAALVSLIGGKGTGKTWAIEQMVKHALAKGRNVFGVTHRINLSRANARRTGLPYIDDQNYKEGSTWLCMDSLLKLMLDAFIGALVLLDEIRQVIEHLMFSSTLKTKRSEILKHLGEIMQTVYETRGQLVIADADLDAKTLRFLQALSGITDKNVFQIVNTYVFDKGDAFMTKGVPLKFGGKILYPADVIKAVSIVLADGGRVFFTVGAQKEESKYSTTTLKQYFLANGVPDADICVVDSETIGDPTERGYRAADRINEICTSYKLVIVSPSLGTGVDIKTKGIDLVAGIFTGVQTSDSVRQAVGRVRDWDVPRIIYAPEVKSTPPNFNLSSNNAFDCYKQAQKNAAEIFDTEWYRESGDLNLIEATEKYFVSAEYDSQIDYYNYHNRIANGLQCEGHIVKKLDSDISPAEAARIINELSDISDGLTLTKRQTTELAPVIDEEEAKKLYAEISLSKEDSAKLSAYAIRNQLGIEPTIEVQEALYSDNKRSKLEHNYAAFQGRETFNLLQQQQHHWAQNHNDAKEAAPDYVHRSLIQVRRDTLDKVNFFDWIRIEFDSTAAGAIVEKLLQNPVAAKVFGSLRAGAKDGVKAVQAIASIFNLAVRQTRKVQGKRFYQGADQGFLADNTDLKPKVLEHWDNKRGKSTANWLAYKIDLKKVRKGAELDGTDNLPPLQAEDYKYASLKTRSRASYVLPFMPKCQMVSEDNFAEFASWVLAQAEVAVDIETYGAGKQGGLDHLEGHIRLIQLASSDAIWVVADQQFSMCFGVLKTLLMDTTKRKVGHNFLFDLRFLRKQFDVLAVNCADTMLGSRCLLGDSGAGQLTKHSLAQASENFLGVVVDKTEQTSDWGGDLTEAQVTYAAKDAWMTYLLYKRLEALTKTPSLLLLPFPNGMAWEAWEVENNFLFAVQQMEATGYKIDIPALTAAIKKYQTALDSCMAKWDAPCKPSEGKKLQKWLGEKYGREFKSLDKAAASALSEIPEIKLMQQINSLKRLLLKCQRIEEQIAFNDGRVKTVFRSLSGTGRCSTGNTKLHRMLINLQSMEAKGNPVLEEFKLPKIKSLFLTNLIIDLPASHGRISAELSNDPNALEAYCDDSKDMHCGTAAAVGAAVFPDDGITAEWIQANKKNPVEPKAGGLRDTAKNTYYGWLNGAGVATVQRQIASNLQIDANLGLCKIALDGLKNYFPGTTAYSKEKLTELETNSFILNGNVCGWYEFAGTYLCWRLGPVGGNIKIPATKAFAGIWSRTESLLMKRACFRIAEKFAQEPSWSANLQNFVHDEVNCEFDAPEAAEFAHKVVAEEFGRICTRTIVGFDPLQKCITYSGKDKDGNKIALPITNWSHK